MVSFLSSVQGASGKPQCGILPPYSPDLAPSDYFLFPALKRHLSETRFTSDDAVKTAAEKWLNEQGPDYYQAGINKLVKRSDKCLNRFGDYVEK